MCRSADKIAAWKTIWLQALEMVISVLTYEDDEKGGVGLET